MAARMKLKLKEEELDRSTREAEKYKRVTIELYGEKSALETELKKVEQRNTEHVRMNVCVCMGTLQFVHDDLHTKC